MGSLLMGCLDKLPDRNYALRRYVGMKSIVLGTSEVQLPGFM